MTRPESRLLACHDFFRDLDEAKLTRIADLAVTKRYRSGERIFAKGDTGNALYGILSGRVRICVSGADGREIILNVMNEGELFGEIALLDDYERTADAVAQRDTELMMIRRRDFMPLLQRDAEFAVYFIRILCRRIRWVSELIEDTSFLPLPNRLAKRLLILWRAREDENRPMAISQAELGQMMGTSREAINRHLQVWARQGLIALGRGQLDILDLDRLDALAVSD